MPIVRGVAGLLGLTGTLVFGLAFALSWAAPGHVENIARELIRAEVEKRVTEAMQSLDSNPVARLAERLSGRNQDDRDGIRHRLADAVPKTVARIVAEMRDPDCACRRPVGHAPASTFDWRGAHLGQINDQLTLLVRSQYLRIAKGLTREFRIFTAANALVFLLLGVAAAGRQRDGRELLIPALILLAAAFGVALIYLFGQNWLQTIVFNDYIGFGYTAWLAIAFAFLGDLIVNRARVTRAMLETVGSGVTCASPC